MNNFLANYPFYSEGHLVQTIKTALQEDIGEGDHSTLSCIPKGAESSAQLLVKEGGTISGIELAAFIFKHYDPSLQFEQLKKDGDIVKKGEIAFKVYGKSRTILTCERTVLNFMQHLSGISTQTRFYVNLIEGTAAKVLDTRKTTPGLRILEKWAVSMGGGENHRFGLHDMILIKDNHIDYAGGIKNALISVKDYLYRLGKKIAIEIEARNLDEVEEILKAGGVKRIMLDNFSTNDTKKAVALIGDTAETESSGGITSSTIRSYAECGVDYISVGALTHSVKSLDLSLKAC